MSPHNADVILRCELLRASKDDCLAQAADPSRRRAKARLLRMTMNVWKLMSGALVADRAEMLVDAKHDQDEFRGDARKDDADHHAGDRRQQQNEPNERTDRHRSKAVKDAGNAEQRKKCDAQPVEGLDDGG